MVLLDVGPKVSTVQPISAYELAGQFHLSKIIMIIPFIKILASCFQD